jgi:hypothetical protein
MTLILADAYTIQKVMIPTCDDNGCDNLGAKSTNGHSDYGCDIPHARLCLIQAHEKGDDSGYDQCEAYVSKPKTLLRSGSPFLGVACNGSITQVVTSCSCS